MYNNFKRSEALLWLAEALNERDCVIMEVIDEIKEVKIGGISCAMLRKKIPFNRIFNLIF